MDKQTAVGIIRDTFESPFDKARFVYFIKNLLNKIDETKAFHIQGNYIPESFRGYVKTYERIGTYTDSENNKIDILVVYLQKETSLERARTAQRNFVARYLKERDEKEAGLVAFVSPDEEDWRFSLVKMDYLLEESPSGKTKVRTELTPARRFSFIVGKNESSHTAQSQLGPILQDDAHDPTLKQLEAAFNIEKATREFFEKYRELFLDVKEALEDIVSKEEKVRDDFAAKGVSTVDFAKKLLGQIVFLYFLQKKGWFGVGRDKDWGTGPKNFLRLLFDKKNVSYQNFFNDVLEPLFYEALATERADDFYSRFNCKIPFLNGGLFDPINNYNWVHADILLPNELFSNKKNDSDEGNGILDIFDLYNFTVKEDEPLEKEVAIDPEMLGKVFENLLEVKDRKSKGTYYTPREIVHYMCQESLINYLDTAINTGDVSLVPTRPPQGKLFGQPDPEQVTLKTSGYRVIIPREDIEEFIRKGELAIENEITVLQKLGDIEQGRIKSSSYKPMLKPSIRENARLIDDKLNTVRVCDPAVGSGAFLVGMMTEVVRARNVLTDHVEDKERRTNYKFKRHAIQNCLYGVDIDPGAVEIAKLRLWLSLVVDEEDIKQIQPLPNLDYKIVCGNSLLGVERRLENWQLCEKLEQLEQLHFNETNARKKQEYKNQIDTTIREIASNDPSFYFQVYFSKVFREGGGFDVVIANPPYGFRNVLSKDEKDHFRKEKSIQFPSGDVAELFIVISLRYLVRENGNMTFIIPKKSLYGESWKNVRKIWISRRLTYLMDASKAFEKVLLEQVSFSLIKGSKGGERITIGAFNQSQDRIDVFGSFPLEDIFSAELKNAQIYRGLVPKSILGKIETHAVMDTGQLVRAEIGISNITDQLTFEANGNYPCVKGIDIFKYGLGPEKRYLKDRIAKKYLSQYQGHKIVAQEIVAHIQNPFPHIQITMFYDDANRLINDTCVEIRSLNLKLEQKFLLAYYQSTFCNWYAYNLIYNRAIRTMHFIDYYVTQVPIPKSVTDNPDQQKKFVPVVDQILAITEDEDYLANPAKQASVKEYERQIDQMVYELYGLTLEEIAVVEG